MTLRPYLIGTVLGLISCARFAASSEPDGKVGVFEQRMRAGGTGGPALFRKLPSRSGRTFAVSPRGRDINDCTERAPCREIQRAIALATAPGDTVLVADGEYRGFVADGMRGTASLPITIFATGRGAVVQPEASCEKKACRDTIVIRNSRHFIIDGLSSRQAPRAAVAILYGDHVTVRHGRFHDNRRWGIFTSFADDVVIERNEISASHREHGIYLSNSGDRPTVRANLIYDNDGSGIHVNGDFRERPEMDRSGRSFYSGQVDGIISGASIEGNLIFRNGSGKIAKKRRRGGSGINLDGVWDSVVKDNVLFDNSGAGIAAFGDADGVIDDSPDDGDGRFGPQGLTITNNTVVMPELARNALQLRLSHGPNVVSNNILLHADSRRVGLEFVTALDAFRVTSNANVLERVSVGDRVRSLEVWRRESGQDKQSLAIPIARLFVDPANGDYSVVSASPAKRLNASPIQGPDIAAQTAREQRPCSVGACPFF